MPRVPQTIRLVQHDARSTEIHFLSAEVFPTTQTWISGQTVADSAEMDFL